MPRARRSMPGALSQGKNVYPIIGYRARLANTAVAAANNEREVIDFDLEFEDNEVMDIWAVEYQTNYAPDAIDAFDDLDLLLGVFENPDIVAATDLSLEATFEDESSLVHFWKTGFLGSFTTSGMTSTISTAQYSFQFPQPYTVARNIALITQMDGTEGTTVALTTHATVWGRRRKAPDSEFKNIIYRQRF